MSENCKQMEIAKKFSNWQGVWTVHRKEIIEVLSNTKGLLPFNLSNIFQSICYYVKNVEKTINSHLLSGAGYERCVRLSKAGGFF